MADSMKNYLGMNLIWILCMSPESSYNKILIQIVTNFEYIPIAMISCGAIEKVPGKNIDETGRNICHIHLHIDYIRSIKDNMTPR